MTTLLQNVLKLSKIDAALARVFAERKKLLDDLKALDVAIDQGMVRKTTLEKALSERRFRYQREEKILKDEQEQLVKRRKALATLGNYKTQQAASREIEHAARELGAREETLIAEITIIDDIERQVAEAATALQNLNEKREKQAREAVLTKENLDFRETTYQEQRRGVAGAVDQSNLIVYNRVKDKFPMNPAVAVVNGNCAGCFMQVAPQLVVQIGMGGALVKCRGCGRILYLPEQEVEGPKD